VKIILTFRFWTKCREIGKSSRRVSFRVLNLNGGKIFDLLFLFPFLFLSNECHNTKRREVWFVIFVGKHFLISLRPFFPTFRIGPANYCFALGSLYQIRLRTWPAEQLFQCYRRTTLQNTDLVLHGTLCTLLCTWLSLRCSLTEFRNHLHKYCNWR